MKTISIYKDQKFIGSIRIKNDIEALKVICEMSDELIENGCIAEVTD